MVLDDFVPANHVCRVLMRGLSGAKVEIGLATMACNLKRITNVLGATKLAEALHQA